MPKILITGGAGFIGSMLANSLAKDGHEVRVIDDLTTGQRSNLSPEIHFTEGDISNVPQLWTLLQDVDCVYHLAARVSVMESLHYPREYNDVNTGGTVSLMEAMRDAGVKRVILSSSGAVYGQQKVQPIAEAAQPNPDSPYAVSKLAAEQYLHTIGRLWSIETVALRIFNTYGPQQNLPISHAPVVPRFLQQALSGGSIVIFGNGDQTRDFVYISDVIKGLKKAATIPDLDHQVINIGSGIETKIMELVHTIEKVLGRSLNIINNATKDSGVSRLKSDISLAERVLDYVPEVTLAEGIQRILEEDQRFRNYLS